MYILMDKETKKFVATTRYSGYESSPHWVDNPIDAKMFKTLTDVYFFQGIFKHVKECEIMQVYQITLKGIKNHFDYFHTYSV